MKTKLEIKRMGINGEGIGFWQQKPVFVEGALKDELVLVDHMQSFGKYFKADLVKVIQTNPNRCNIGCKKYQACGGCDLMHANYNYQLQCKQNYLVESLQKYAPKVPLELVEPIIGSTLSWGYRNHAKLLLKKYNNHWHAGLYQSGSNHFQAIDHYCKIHDDNINRLIQLLLVALDESNLTNYDHTKKSGLRAVAIRYVDDQCSITLVTGKESLDKAWIQRLAQLTHATVIAQVMNTTKNMVNILDGNIIYLTKMHHLNVKINELTVAITPQAFFQLNTSGLNQMIQIIDRYLPNCCSLFEGYCGVGLLSLAVSNKIKRGLGVEIVEPAIVAANKNARNNHIDCMQYKVGDSAKELRYYHQKHPVDVVLVDPPRSGLDDNMITTLLKSNIKTIIYVSCNPSTLAKNLSQLNARYKVKAIQPLDMFPQTLHVETVVLLQNTK